MKTKKIIIRTALAVVLLSAVGLIVAFSLNRPPSPHQQMVSILEELNKRNTNVANPFNPESKIAHCDSLLSLPNNSRNVYTLAAEAPLLLRQGKEQKAVGIYEDLIK